MKKLFFLLSILCASHVYAATSTIPGNIPNVTETISEYREDGSFIDAEYTTRNGIKHGPYKEHIVYPITEHSGDDAIHTTIETGFYELGEKASPTVLQKTDWSEFTFVNGLKHGPFIVREDDDMVVKGTYSNDMLNGVVSHYRNNVLLEEYSYKDTMKNGPFKLFYEKDGKLRVAGFYNDNELDGEITVYFESAKNGTIAVYIYYENDVPILAKCPEQGETVGKELQSTEFDLFNEESAQFICLTLFN